MTHSFPTRRSSDLNKAGKRIRYKLNRRPSQINKQPPRSQGQLKHREHEKSSVRAKVEHVFGVVKGRLRYRKTRYRGLQKQTAKCNMLLDRKSTRLNSSN